MGLDEELFEAIDGNKLSEVVRLLQAGANPNARNGGKSALDQVHHRQDAIRCTLIEAGAFQPDQLSSLVWAVNTGREATVKALIDGGADVNQTTYSGTPLQVAAALGHLEIARMLIHAGADLEAKGVRGTPLNMAITGNHSALALLLLQHHAQPVGLESAASLGQLEVVTELLNRGAALEERSRDHETTPLLAACQSGQSAVVERLLEAGANPHARDARGSDACHLATPEVKDLLAARGIQSRQSPEEALLAAAQNGALEALHQALKAGANVDAPDSRKATRGRTALALAAQAGHLPAVEALLAAGANPTLLDGETPRNGLKKFFHFAGLEGLHGEPLGRTALFWAAQAGHAAIVAALLQAGSAPHSLDFLGLTPLALAAKQGHLQVVKDLVGAGGNPNDALLEALEAEQAECALHLLQAGAKPTQKALVLAAGLAHLPLLQAFWKPKSKLKAGPALARLMFAVRQVPLQEAPPGNWVRTFNEGGGWATVPQPEERILETMEFLLTQAPDLRYASDLGPPLMVAARQGLARAVRRLLAAGADPSQDYKGDTALSLARLFQHEEVIQILLQAGAAEATPDPEPPPPEPGPELPQPLFEPNPEFLQVVAELESLCGSPAQAKEYLCGGREFYAPEGKLDTLELQRKFRPRGCFVFEPQKGLLAVLPTPHWGEAVAVMQTNGANHNLSPYDVLHWMLALEKDQPFELRRITHDTLAGIFLTPIADPKGMAERMYQFCSDIVDQGCESVTALASELRKKPPKLYFWWD